MTLRNTAFVSIFHQSSDHYIHSTFQPVFKMWSACLFVCASLVALASAAEWLSLMPAHQVKIHKNMTIPVSFQPYKISWQQFKSQHGKTYLDDLEETYRFNIFVRNLKKIETHNDLFLKGEKSYFLGINQFADMRVEEFIKYNGLIKVANRTPRNCSSFIPPNFLAAPTSVDWRKKGYVTPVKNQGQCGSCWSFSTTGSMEGQYFRKNKNLKSFSEQQLVDCSTKYGDHGCQGGLMDFAFEYVKRFGLEQEADYPYKAKEMKCKYEESKVVTKDTGCEDISHGSEDDLKAAVASQGPISVAIDASHSSFQLYSGGVYDEPECSSEQLDHGVLTVGYGVYDDVQDYWLVKNSWGPTWGKEGYIMMSRNKENQCGIATSASFPLV